MGISFVWDIEVTHATGTPNVLTAGHLMKRLVVKGRFIAR